MRSGFLRTILVLVLVLVAFPVIVQAQAVHFFPCEDCHKAGTNINAVTNHVCLDCHDTGSGDVTLNDGSTIPAPGRFDVGDASNSFGHNPAPGKQTSHNWGAPVNNPGAGSRSPSDRFFYGRQNFAAGTVACSRCHDPHGDAATNPTLTKLPSDRINPKTGVNYVVEDMCLDCHVDWNVDSNQGQETHPLVQDYNARVTTINAQFLIDNPDKTAADVPYKLVPDNTVATGAQGDVQLLNGNISCSSCHGVHGVDSDSTTADGLTQTVNAGDGKLLRSDGRNVQPESLCITCHNYKQHGAGNSLGCLDCHSGHSYNDGSVNFYVLRESITNVHIPIGGKAANGSALGDVSGLNFTTANAEWMNATETGYCQGCHDVGKGGSQHQGFSSGDANTNCDGCHSHDELSFTGGACNTCHGYAPDLNVASGPQGFASDGLSDYFTGTNKGVNPKNEAATAHIEHSDLLSVVGGNHQFACTECHANFGTSHKNGVFEDVDFGALAQTGMTPGAYDLTGSGSCDTIYCHSNGGKRTGDGPTRDFAGAPQTIPAWEGGNIPGCNSCHGNDAATMSAGQRDNSTTHAAHLNRGYSCNICHSLTATDNSTLLASATTTGGAHVNAAVDVSFDSTYDLGAGLLVGGSYAQVAGSCAIYCHSNGTVPATIAPDWDTATTGDCGSCHQIDNAGTPAGSGPVLSGAHAKHIFDANGPGLSCSDCHGVGANTGLHSNHINGAVDAPAQAVCNACHGADAGNSLPGDVDRQPVWTDANSVDCETCHLGTLATVQAKVAPTKDDFTLTGHGSIVAFDTMYSAAPCEACHDATAPGHFDGNSGDDLRLNFGGVDNDAFCKNCHGGNNSHFADAATPGGGSTDGDTCATCHEGHGEGMGSNLNRMLTVGTGFDINDYNTFFNAARTGVCQTCHVKSDGVGGIAHYNQTDAPDGHNAGLLCTSCHSHTSNPAFSVGAGTNCNDCHGFPPSDTHVNHTFVADGDLANEDLSDCAYCHTGADQYTYSYQDDQAAGGARGNHAMGQATQVATLLASVGYDGTSCATACHKSSGADGGWADNALNCDACHYYSASPTSVANTADPSSLGGDHGAHFDAGADCDNCHGTLPATTGHITTGAGSDIAKIQDRAQALMDEASIDPTVGTDIDPGNSTCNNTACHNPSSASGATNSATWTVSGSSCTLCHNNDVASGSPMASGSHASHIDNAAQIGDNFSCADCHGDTTASGTNMAHRNATTEVLPAMVWNQAPNLNSCNTLVCHNDSGGKTSSGSEVVTPAWGVTGSDCTLCHSAPSVDGDHGLHWAAARQGLGMTCATCHADTVASNSTIKAGSKHLDTNKTDFVVSGNYDSAPVVVTYNSGPTPSNCTASCHTTGNPKFWENPNSCEACHGDLSFVGGAHDIHTDNVGGIEVDVTECAACHGAAVLTYTYTAGGNHQNGPVNFAAGISNSTCANACHNSTAGDGSWTDADGLNCDACHGNPPAGSNHSQHIAAGMDCADCHGTVDAPGTSPLVHNQSKDNTSDFTKLQTRGEGFLNPTGLDVTVDDTAWNAGGGNSWFNSIPTNDAGNSCSNTDCHNPSGGKVADWDVDTADCTFCHGDDQIGSTAITTGSHERHLDATAKFGLTIGCNHCHPNNVSNDHFISGTAPTTVNSAVQMGGTVITTEYAGELDLPSTAVGSCNTNDCHNNGKGAAPVATYNWGTPVATDCQTCHMDPPTSGRHASHLSNTVSYGPSPSGSTDCGMCHDANSNNTTMASRASHINGSINFNDGNSVATGGIVGDVTVVQCNTCHGGAASANIAKNQWNTTNRLTCESCHGDATLAVIGGITAPSRAGAPYDAAGHGKTGINQACNACHADTSTHISGALGDAKRLQLMGGNDFGVPAQTNNWCNDCHSGSMPRHYDAGESGGSASDSGLYCNLCHDPHGQNGGQDAMVASTIQGHNVTGFADRTNRNSYSQGDFSGVCQVCHADGDVAHFNQATNETTHNSGNCTDCHNHNDSIAFAASGCSGCHGGGTVGTNASNYWPDTGVVAGENTAGRHVKHMTELASVVYNENFTQLLTDNVNGTSDAKQKNLCSFCHATPGADGDHGSAANLPAETNGMKNIWNGAADNASYNAVADTCATANCHNNQLTQDGTYGWYDAGVSTCTMCHTVGVANDIANNNIHPNTGLHNMTEAGVEKHSDQITGGDCSSCHTTPGSTHRDGVAVGETNFNTDRGLVAAVTYAQGNVNQSTCMPSGALSACHSDGGAWGRQWSTAADSTATNVGAARCDVCHGQINEWRTGLSVPHNLAGVNATTNHSTCKQCHVAPDAPYDFGTMHDDGDVQFNGNAAMNYDTGAGTCTSICHSNDASHSTMNASTIFPEVLLGGGPGADCNACHDATGGFAAGRAAHAVHVNHSATSQSDYGDTSVTSGAGQYDFGCGTCHPAAGDWATLHNNGVVNVSLNSTHGGVLKSLNGVANNTGGYSQSDTTPGDGGSTTCSAAYCHSDTAGTFATTPDWYAALPSFTGDRCASCHLNSPATSSHAAHQVGIHYDDIYTGTTGLLADGGVTGAGHGDVNTAITINCNLCHNGTVTSWANDQNAVCGSCHDGGTATLRGDATIANTTLHVNGVKDVAFAPVPTVKSKAQIRDFSATEPELDNNWTRTNGYKAATDSFDEAVILNTGSMYVPGTKNCTVSCHNGNTVQWGAAGVSCNDCHTQLPK